MYKMKVCVFIRKKFNVFLRKKFKETKIENEEKAKDKYTKWSIFKSEKLLYVRI